MTKRLKTISACTLLLLLAFVESPADPTVTAPTASNADTLQEAVNAFASIGMAADCATYQTGVLGSNGQSIVQNVCRVNGTWADSDMSLTLSPDELRSAMNDAGGAPANLFTADPESQQISAEYTVPTATTYTQRIPPSPTPPTPSMPGPPVSQTISTVSMDAQLGCMAATTVVGMFSTLFSHGAATEITQTCNKVILYSQLAQMVAIQASTGAHYRLSLQQALYLPMMIQYQARSWGAWRNATAANTYGHNSGWISNTNAPTDTYPASVRPLPSPATATMLAPEAQEGWRRAYSDAQLSDGVNQGALNTVGGIRGSSGDAAAAIQKLESSVYSQDPSLNTATAIAGKQSIAAAIQVRQNEDTKRLLAAQVEMQALQAKQERDAYAAAAQDQADRRAAAAQMKAETQGASNAIRSFRF